MKRSVGKKGVGVSAKESIAGVGGGRIFASAHLWHMPQN